MAMSSFSADRQKEMARAQQVGAEVAERSRKRLENTLYWAKSLLAAESGELEQTDPTSQRSSEIKDEHITNYQTLIKLVEVMFSLIKQGKKVRERTVRMITDEILRNILQDRFLQTNLVNIKVTENYMAGHAVNVAILAANIGCHMKLDARRIREVIIAGLFQGIGLLKLPSSIIDKPGQLTAEERLQLQRHSIYAIAYLDKHLDLSKMVGLLISQSNERLDGSGYPKGRRANNLHPHSQIIAVANIYDALTSVRPWRGPMSPYEATETLLHMSSDNKLDTDVVRAFLQCNSLFPVGSMVLLSNGQMARVIAANTDQLTRPVVRLYDRDTKEWGEVVNLAGVDDLQVKRCLSSEILEDHDPLAGF
ncbi:HD-GYP domain-containing protein [bacterium AH-315-F18]|nr:HD-GYP domain-containing protein [bacterium AH-315-F18]